MVKAEYQNNYKEYKKFGTFHIFIARMKHLFMFSGLFLGLGIVFTVLAMLGNSTFASGAIICFIFVFILPLLNWIKQFMRIKKTVKSNANFLKTENYYTFNDNDFDLLIKVNKKEEKHKIKYTELYRVYETKTNFYLYIDAFRALIITKEGVTEGTTQQLSDIFKREIENKYFIKGKKEGK